MLEAGLPAADMLDVPAEMKDNPTWHISSGTEHCG
jgi:hypothetical protein